MSNQPLKPAGHRTQAPRRATIILVLLIVLAAVYWGISTRLKAAAELQKSMKEQAVPSVTVMHPLEGPATEEIVLPGTVQAWHEAPIYARTNGYLKDWRTDIGARVRAGDLLAEIETPEVDAQLRQAEADFQTAKANNDLAQSTSRRWQLLLKTQSVPQQEADEKQGDAAAKEAVLASAAASLKRLRELENFKRVTAPFNGVITARNTDTGALINAGSGSAGQELFRIAEADRLRVYIQVPEAYAHSVTKDLTAELHFAEYPGKSFPASLLTSADALDPATRTLRIQLQADNREGLLLPGSYAEVHLKLPSGATVLQLPVNALLFKGAGLQAGTVGADGRVRLKTIVAGRDFGTWIEVVSGLTGGDTVIVNPPDSLIDGETVRIVTGKAEGANP